MKYVGTHGLTIMLLKRDHQSKNKKKKQGK